MNYNEWGTRELIEELEILNERIEELESDNESMVEQLEDKKEIDYYGEEDNYIHIKFGDIIKRYRFQEGFRKEHSYFVEQYENYWEEETDKNDLKTPEDFVNYAYDNNIPVNWYFNYTDTPAESKEEILEYFINENN